MELADRVKSIVSDTLKIPVSSCNEELTAGDIEEWDSLGHVNLLSAIEKEFNVAFDVGDAIEIESIGDLLDMLQKYKAESDASSNQSD